MQNKMKIYVIGTSNFVVRDGWFAGISFNENIEIINLSVGRVPCLMHLSTIMIRFNELKTADCIILDHSINDNGYMVKVGDSYLEYINDLLCFASSLNIPVVNMIFLKEGQYKEKIVNHIIDRCGEYHLYYIDFTEMEILPEFYEDSLHLKSDFAFFLGIELSKILQNHELVYNETQISCSTSYCIYTCEDMVLDSKNISKDKIIETTNSLGVFRYIPLEGSISLTKFSDYELMGIAYFSEPDTTYTFHLKNSHIEVSYRTSGVKFYFELLDEPMLIDADSLISFDGSEIASDIPVLMQREEPIYTNKKGVNISYMLFRKKDLERELSNTLEKTTLDLTSLLKKKLKNVVNLFAMKKIMKNLECSIDGSSKSADILRDVAISFEAIGDIVTARSIMLQAQFLRPTGEGINKKIKDYDNMIAKGILKI